LVEHVLLKRASFTQNGLGWEYISFSKLYKYNVVNNGKISAVNLFKGCNIATNEVIGIINAFLLKIETIEKNICNFGCSLMYV
jgi:hypothetical protein